MVTALLAMLIMFMNALQNRINRKYITKASVFHWTPLMRGLRDSTREHRLGEYIVKKGGCAAGAK